MGGPNESILSKSFYPLSLAVTGFISGGIVNQINKRPYFAGIQRHVAFAIAGGLVGLWYNGFLERKFSKRDAIIRHYIELHPEDFKEEKRQYKEMLSAWYPQR